MASAMNSTPGAVTWQQSFINCRIRCASRSFWLVVPIFFHRKATASRRTMSAPWLAQNRMMSSISMNTAGLL